MDDFEQALANAREVLVLFGGDNTWGAISKLHLERRIVAEIPEHRVYFDAFAGVGQILFTKPPSEVEVVADLDPGA